MLGRVLVVDDKKNINLVIQAILEKAGFEVMTFHQSQEALEALASEEFDTVITDLYMPGPGGMEILEYCRQQCPSLPVVMMTAFGTVETAVSALKQGAFDFITKPFDQMELLNVVRKAIATHRQLQKEPRVVQEMSFSMIGESFILKEIFKTISKVASSSATVLISGESGTGKELVAHEIHQHSDRSQKPFVKINCAAIPATLIESELFGYEKGAFTGAVTSKPGRFELAHEGTLFLDEVAEMPLEMQAKLLRVLQHQEFERVGGLHTLKVDVRLIAATNKDLDLEMKQGRFREDLYYRLKVVPIHLPPLRERASDIPLLMNYFLKQLNQKFKKNLQGWSPQVQAAFQTYSWPGNIRQLENVLERMVLMSEGSVLSYDDLTEEFQSVTVSGQTSSLKQIVRQQAQALERGLIEKALKETSGNVTRAAENLGLSRKGLQLKMKELAIKRDEF